MEIVKFNAKNLIDYTVYEDEDHFYVKLLYENGEKILKIDSNSKIFHYQYNNVGNLGWITFFERSEVFNIPEFERKGLCKKYSSIDDSFDSAFDNTNKTNDNFKF